jgi:hypothetical protein
LKDNHNTIFRPFFASKPDAFRFGVCASRTSRSWSGFDKAHARGFGHPEARVERQERKGSAWIYGNRYNEAPREFYGAPIMPIACGASDFACPF